MTKKSKTTLKIIAITLYAILVLPLLLGSLNVIVDSFVPRNLVEHHYMTQYRLIDSPQDMEENLSVARYKHNSSGEILTINNTSLILPWSGTDPGTIAQKDNEDTVVYKPITDFKNIKEKGNYIIVVQNKYDNKWYAYYR